ncbi:MAG: protein-tyrosine-phosphatase [Aquaticitalea sp.]
MIKTQPSVFPGIATLIAELDIQTISEERKGALKPLIDFIQSKVSNKEDVRINFICTHNSRRSHLSQIWAQTMAYQFNIKHVFCYSGGTETTALFPIVVQTLQNSGFEIQTLSEGDNPVYSIKYSENEHPVVGFSKKMDDDFNPKSNFAAIMTCDSANEACPFVPGAEKRIPITFEDPKAFDHSPLQKEKYKERSSQIATEMMYVFSQIKS